VLEVAPLDGKRRLVLLRRDDTEHLVLLGQESATVIEANISPPPLADRGLPLPLAGEGGDPRGARGG
jgi:hypothetical protein